MKKAIKKPFSKFGWPMMRKSCWNCVPKLVALACDEESEETETIYDSKSLISHAINLEPMRIFRCGKRHSVEAGDVHKHAKFQYNRVRTRLRNDGTKLRLWCFGPAVIYSATFAAWSLLVWGGDRFRGRTVHTSIDMFLLLTLHNFTGKFSPLYLQIVWLKCPVYGHNLQHNC